jgi:hypothetical protein
MEWSHVVSPRKKKLKSALLAGNIMVTVFWDGKGVIILNFLSREDSSELHLLY